MAVTVDQYIDSLTLSGLISRDELRAFLNGLPPEKKPSDAESLARELVRVNRLTKYQARSVYWGKGEPLQFGDYEVLDRLGAGSMGRVYKARHRQTEEKAAIKVLPAAAMRSVETRERFQREIRLTSKLVHPNVVAALGAGESGGEHFLVMQYVEGRDLKSLLKERGRFPVCEALKFGIRVGRGLEYAHAMGVVHRDIKPSNLLLTPEGDVKLLDLGLAVAVEDQGMSGSDRLTVQGQILGTANYMPPEQVEDTRMADGRSDIYALGATLFHLISGRPPYVAETVSQVLLAHSEAPIPSICELVEEAPAVLDSVLMRMMAKNPQDRYQTMTDVLAALESCRTAAKSSVGVSSGGAGSWSSSFDETLNEQSTPDGLQSMPPSRAEPGGQPGPSDTFEESGYRETVACDAAQETKSSIRIERVGERAALGRGTVWMAAAVLVLGAITALCWILLR